MEEGKSAFKIITGKLTGKRSLGRPRRRLEEILEWTTMRGIVLILLRIGIIGEPFEYGIKPPGSISHGVS